MALLEDLATRVLGLPSTCPACPSENLLPSAGQVECYGHSSWSHISGTQPRADHGSPQCALAAPVPTAGDPWLLGVSLLTEHSRLSRMTR